MLFLKADRTTVFTRGLGIVWVVFLSTSAHFSLTERFASLLGFISKTRPEVGILAGQLNLMSGPLWRWRLSHSFKEHETQFSETETCYVKIRTPQTKWKCQQFTRRARRCLNQMKPCYCRLIAIMTPVQTF